jgi:SAM-dependent methyltransferase
MFVIDRAASLECATPRKRNIMNRRKLIKSVKSKLSRLVGRPQSQSNPRPAGSDAELWERSRLRWRKAEPVTHLTWGIEVSGTDFIRQASLHGGFGPDKSLLEIGPGYGRLLQSIIDQSLPFGSYLGVDLSEQNVSYLKKRLANSRIDFVSGDIEQVRLNQKFDTLFSSLTFKHLFPSFENALANATRHLNSDALVFFDLIEGSGQLFELDQVTYIRHYQKPEILQILARTGLRLIAWEEVLHTPRHSRLLVVAGKSTPAS